ncbi:MAG: 3-dehydroquinate synthase [Elusimicrobia bacterium]|nr:3-dehydroquinate synthase [Elusimicrobiota bacterium]
MSRVFAGPGAAAGGAWARGLAPGGRVMLVSERVVFKLFGRKVLGALMKYKVSVFLLPSGEKAKDWSAVSRLLSAMLSKGLGRDSGLVALGGGAVTDAAGFAASIYLRGIPWVAVPTTLLGQLDSGIGGKTAINLPEGKNLAGTFYQPTAIVCDTSFLKTLPARERVSGLAEAIKYGLTFDPGLWKYIRAHWDELLAGKQQPTAHVVRKGAAWKLKIVAKDERETKGIRDLLNFGHTFGHALEKAAGYGRLRHGEAVVWGMRCALSLSVRGAGLPVRVFNEVENFFVNIPLPSLRGIKPAEVLAAALKDKKARQGRVRFALLKDIGRPVVRVVEGSQLTALARSMLPLSCSVPLELNSYSP